MTSCKENPGFFFQGKFIKVILKFHKLRNESQIRRSYTPSFLYLLHCTLKIQFLFHHKISHNNSDWSRNSLNTMNQNSLLSLNGLIDKVETRQKDTFYILNGRVFYVKSFILNFFWKFILTVISSQVQNNLYFRLFQNTLITSHFITR